MLRDHLLHPTLPASDLGRARAFWEGLGLDCETVDPEDERAGFTATAGNAKFLIYPSAFAGTNQATAAAFQVEDVVLEVKQLRDQGVEILEYDLPDFKTADGIMELPNGVKGAWFKDSEGNIIGLSDTTLR